MHLELRIVTDVSGLILGICMVGVVNERYLLDLSRLHPSLVEWSVAGVFCVPFWRQRHRVRELCTVGIAVDPQTLSLPGILNHWLQSMGIVRGACGTNGVETGPEQISCSLRAATSRTSSRERWMAEFSVNHLLRFRSK